MSDLLKELERGMVVLAPRGYGPASYVEFGPALIEYVKATDELREWSPGQGQHQLYLVRSKHDAKLTALLAALRGGK